MTVTQRIRKVINWLIFIEYAENERDLAEKLGYTKSSFSQIVNGKVPLADKFVKKLCSADNNINEVWITEGGGEMFLNSPKDVQMTTIPSDAWEVIKTQAESLKNKDEQINELIFLLKQQMEDMKKTVARREDNATSAAVG
jgi:transcriptional regulator with XRE-family HTH domain